MTSKPTKGNPRASKNNPRENRTDSQNSQVKSVAKARAFKSDGIASSGNPRAKLKSAEPELQGFNRTSISDVQKAKAEKSKEKTGSKMQEPRVRAIAADSKTQRGPEERSERRLKQKRKVTALKVLGIIFGVLLVAAIGAVIYLANSDYLKITEVEYVGTDHLTEAECKALAPSPEGQNLLTFDAGKIEAGFKRDSWVESVSFNRVFPNKLQIVVKERKIGAVVEFNSGANQIAQSWIITLDGMWIMAIPNQDSDTGKLISQNIYTDADSAVHIKDCPNGIAPEIGGKCSDETVLNSLAILNGFSTDLKDQVKSISASNINATTLRLTNNVEIAFGSAENVRDKERIAKGIMEENDKVVYINVRSTDRPTWRSAS